LLALEGYWLEVLRRRDKFDGIDWPKVLELLLLIAI
jgi:hypothetical protein